MTCKHDKMTNSQQINCYKCYITKFKEVVYLRIVKICTSRTTSDTTQKLMKHKQRFEFFTLFWLAITYNRKLSYLIIHLDVL